MDLPAGGVCDAMIRPNSKRVWNKEPAARPRPSMRIVPKHEVPPEDRRPHGMSGWQALAVLVVCAALVTATFFLAPV